MTVLFGRERPVVSVGSAQRKGWVRLLLYASMIHVP
jgi:hypothetical protein